jgi:hypothetical protein
MAGVLQHLRSSTLDKRPNPASMVDGQVAINYASGAPGMFFKDSNGSLVKVGPVHVGSGAPNASPASGGTAGNSLGEQWLDTSGGTYVFKVWDGSAWRSEAGEFVNVTGDTMTGALGIIAGSASTPGLFFSGDANSGLYSPGADQVAISTNSSERIRIGANGEIGLGGTNYGTNGQVLTSAGSGAAPIWTTPAAGNTDKIEEGNTSAEVIDTGSDGRFVVTTEGTERLRVDSSGRLLAGYTSTTNVAGFNAALQLQGTSFDTATAALTSVASNNTGSYLLLGKARGGTLGGYGIINAGDTFGQIRFLGADGAKYVEAGRVEVSSAGSPGTDNMPSYMAFYTNGGSGAATERARIDSSGRLLVGTSTARSNFFNGTTFAPQIQVEGDNAQKAAFSVIASQNGGASRFILGTTRGPGVGSYAAVQSGDTPGIISFQGADGTELVEAASIACEVDGTPGANDMPGRLVFSTTADGASSPVERVRIANDGFVSFAGNTTTGIRVPASNELAIRANGTDAVRVLSNQRVAVGGTTSAFNLVTIQSNAAGLGAFGLVDTSGDNVNRNLVHFARNADSTGNIVGTISTTNTATSYNTSSDYRLKENVVPLTGALDRLQQIPVHRFNFIADPDKTVDGFLAHEAQEIVPECVTGEKDAVDDEGNPVYQGIDQSKLVPLLTAALQEAMERIETLEAKVAALEGV